MAGGVILKEKKLDQLLDQLDPAAKKEYEYVLLKLLNETFPIEYLTLLLQEMNPSEIRKFQKLMNVRTQKTAEIDGLLQIIKLKVNTTSGKISVLKAITYTLIDIYTGENPDLTDSDFLSKENEIINKFGQWHYFWALRMFPRRSDAIDKRLEELIQSANGMKQSQDTSILKPPIDQKETKVSKETLIIKQERQLRQENEKTITRLNKEIKEINKAMDQLIKANNDLSKKLISTEKDLLDVQNQNTQLSKEVSQLEYENKYLVREITQLNSRISEYEEQELTLKQINEAEKSRLLEQVEVYKNNDSSPSFKAEGLIEIIHKDALKKLNLINLRTIDLTEKQNLRYEITQMLNLASQIESYFIVQSENHQESDIATSSNEHSQINKSVSEVAVATNIETEDASVTDTLSSNELKRSGTFYRREHGGYIIFDDGQQSVITESIVNAVGLEHEAEVECTKRQRGDGSAYQYIQLLFQGDDTYAPIVQYLGYIELGEHFKYYCVDIHDNNNRYLIHERDVAFHNPTNGVPCLFNVSLERGEYARISKIYKNHEDMKSEDDVFHPKKTDEKIKKPPKNIAPFLQGCKIAVIGGQAKWFESVVKETGAEFVHENGEHPERIFAELRKSNALFKLLTATSHGATISGVEIAKEHNIPHFTIEGSKSNLRNLLWSNRDIIREGGRKQ
jgi:hypothetical protein